MFQPYHKSVFELTEAQGIELKKQCEYQVIARLENGAVLVARSGDKPQPKIIDTDGREFSFRRYLASFTEHA
jgi:hypothetical protein